MPAAESRRTLSVTMASERAPILVEPERVQPRQASSVAARLAQLRQPAELHAGRPAGLLPRHAPADPVLFRHRQVCRQLLVEVAIEVVATKVAAKAGHHHSKKRRHAYLPAAGCSTRPMTAETRSQLSVSA